MSYFMKLLPLVAKLFFVDGRTYGHDKTNSRFSQFCEHTRKRERVCLSLSK